MLKLPNIRFSILIWIENPWVRLQFVVHISPAGTNLFPGVGRLGWFWREASVKRTITSAHRSCRVEPSSLNSHASHSSIQANSINSAISTDEGARETSWTIRFGCCCSAQLNRRDDVNFQRDSFDMSYHNSERITVNPGRSWISACPH